MSNGYERAFAEIKQQAAAIGFDVRLVALPLGAQEGERLYLADVEPHSGPLLKDELLDIQAALDRRAGDL